MAALLRFQMRRRRGRLTALVPAATPHGAAAWRPLLGAVRPDGGLAPESSHVSAFAVLPVAARAQQARRRTCTPCCMSPACVASHGPCPRAPPRVSAGAPSERRGRAGRARHHTRAARGCRRPRAPGRARPGQPEPDQIRPQGNPETGAPPSRTHRTKLLKKLLTVVRVARLTREGARRSLWWARRAHWPTSPTRRRSTRGRAARFAPPRRACCGSAACVPGHDHKKTLFVASFREEVFLSLCVWPRSLTASFTPRRGSTGRRCSTAPTSARSSSRLRRSSAPISGSTPQPTKRSRLRSRPSAPLPRLRRRIQPPRPVKSGQPRTGAEL
jgi:hypothetical protein